MSSTLKRDSAKLSRARKKTGTTGKRKAFSTSDYLKYDGPAVHAVLSHLEAEGIWAMQNADRYGPDIVVWRGLRPAYYIEVAQRSGWEGGDWPHSWTPVRIEERKSHLFNSLGLPCEYWVVSGDAKVSLIIHDAVITEYGVLEEVSNSRISAGEKFICIPLEYCQQKEIGT